MNITQITRKLTLLIAISLGLGSTPSQAEEIPRYQLEIIIFETTALRGWTEEYWPNIEDDLQLENLQNKPSLPKNQFMLKTVAAKMTPKKGYHILSHQSWILKGLPENQAKPIRLENYPQRANQTHFEGSLFFYKSRYNHIDLELQFNKKIPTRVKAKFAQNEQIDLENLPKRWRFNLVESRKIRPKQLHYIDHPLFGVLVKLRYLNNN